MDSTGTLESFGYNEFVRIPKPTSDGRRVPRLVTAILVLLLVLVPVLAWLQYEWTGDASRAEVFRMRSNLRSALAQWMSDFQNLITLDAESGPLPELRAASLTDEQALDRASQLLNAWNQRNSMPGLVSRVSVVSDTQAWSLLPDGTHWSDPFELAMVPVYPFRSSVSLARGPGRRMLIDLNPNVVTQIAVPILVDRYFTGPDGLPGYRLTLRELGTGGEPGTILWSSVPGSDEASIPAEASLPLILSGARFGPVPVNAAVRDLPGNDAGGVQFLRLRNTAPPWVLEARHLDGSVEAFAQKVRWLNLSGTFTLLSVLTFGFLFLYRLYNRNRLAVRAQQDFVSSVSHELKSPLAVLRAAAENLKEGVVSEPDQARRYGERMFSEADRLLFLTENILRYAGLDSGPWSLESENPVDLSALLREKLATWTDDYRQRGVELHVAAADEKLLVRGRTADLGAIADNLLSNALKHGTTGKQPQVTLGWGTRQGKKGKEAWLSVQDNGKGLAVKEQKKVFEPFYRPSGTTVAGVGLGLSLVARLTAAHGGHVELISSPGAGARFTVALQVAVREPV